MTTMDWYIVGGWALILIIIVRENKSTCRFGLGLVLVFISVLFFILSTLLDTKL
jgi:hypothetical protein